MDLRQLYESLGADTSINYYCLIVDFFYYMVPLLGDGTQIWLTKMHLIMTSNT